MRFHKSLRKGELRFSFFPRKKSRKQVGKLKMRTGGWKKFSMWMSRTISSTWRTARSSLFSVRLKDKMGNQQNVNKAKSKTILENKTHWGRRRFTRSRRHSSWSITVPKSVIRWLNGFTNRLHCAPVNIQCIILKIEKSKKILRFSIFWKIARTTKVQHFTVQNEIRRVQGPLNPARVPVTPSFSNLHIFETFLWLAAEAVHRYLPAWEEERRVSPNRCLPIANLLEKKSDFSEKTTNFTKTEILEIIHDGHGAYDFVDTGAMTETPHHITIFNVFYHITRNIDEKSGTIKKSEVGLWSRRWGKLRRWSTTRWRYSKGFPPLHCCVPALRLDWLIELQRMSATCFSILFLIFLKVFCVCEKIVIMLLSVLALWRHRGQTATPTWPLLALVSTGKWSDCSEHLPDSQAEEIHTLVMLSVIFSKSSRNVKNRQRKKSLKQDDTAPIQS